MKTLSLKSGSRALVVVAHPDDEIIWMGGLIRRSKNIDWTIFSLCRQSDSDREPKFWRVCACNGARGIITDLDDEGKLSLEESIPFIKKIITDKIGLHEFDYLFTHGANGDYGHPRHIGVYKAVKELLKEQKIRVKNVFYFNYQKNKKSELPLMIMKKNSEFQLKLNNQEYQEKCRIVAEMYGYPFDGIDVNLSPNPEAFIAG